MRSLVPLVASGLVALLVVGTTASGCGSDGATTGGGGDDGGGGGSGDGAPGDGAGDGTARHGVFVQGGELVVDGMVTTLFGGDLHYFRVRDPGFDGTKTQALWRDSLQKMKDAHMNLVSTYFPWDYHAPSDGQWDFQGARDVDAFLKMTCDAGMKVIAKPGPLITGEWPYGFGSYGAVPAWWKAAHPDSLVKKADGSPFSFSLTGDAKQQQPTYLDDTYLASVGGWFDHILPIVKKYVDSRCVIGLQVDNETNLYWANRFGDVDYNPRAVAHYRAFLATRYGSVGTLNAAYGTTYATFDAVVPPSKMPASALDNVAARDWYDAGEAYVLAYMKTVRGMIEARGIHEPDVIFLTNDSPFGIPTRNLLVHDGRVKNQVGLTGLDLYPKQLPTNGELNDNPFQVDYDTKLYEVYNHLYTKDPGAFAFGAELQGGFYDFPLGVHPNVAPESTDQLLAKGFGHGLRGGSFYILRGGINLDGSSYDFQAAIGLDGSLRPRYDVLKSWGAMLASTTLARADEIEDPIAIVQDPAYAVPQAGTNDDLQALYTTEYDALFGWLVNAGFNPAVVDASLATADDLAKYKVVFTLAPQLVDRATAGKLVAYHQGGGVIVQTLDPGSRALDGSTPKEVSDLAALFPVDSAGMYSWPGLPLRSGMANQKLSGAEGQVRTYWYETFWNARPSDPVSPLILERQQPLGGDGKIVAFETVENGAPRALLGGYVASVFNASDYYGADVTELGLKRALARHLVGLGGVTPTLSATAVKEEAWARVDRGQGIVYLFVVSDHDAGTVHVDIADLAPLGLDGATTYSLTELRHGASYGTRTGASLRASGIDVPLPKYGVGVVQIRKP